MDAERATVVDANTEFEGKLTGRHVRILGRFQGEIEISGTLASGEGSRIEAKVRADAAEIGGELKGEVLARRLVVLEKGHIEGSVHVELLAVREGARLDGTVSVSGAQGAGNKAGSLNAPRLLAPAKGNAPS
jgi:cytoskeletal protein CcmA (bactofilin family)